MSFPIEPVLVSVVVATFQTFAGSDVMDDAIEESETPSDVDAVNTCAFVLAFTTAAKDVVAMAMLLSVLALTAAVPAVTAEPSEEEAV